MDELGFEITFNTHEIRVHKLGNEIRCWKIAKYSTEYEVDFEIFYDKDQAIDFIISSPPAMKWHIDFME